MRYGALLPVIYLFLWGEGTVRRRDFYLLQARNLWYSKRTQLILIGPRTHSSQSNLIHLKVRRRKRECSRSFSITSYRMIRKQPIYILIILQLKEGWFGQINVVRKFILARRCTGSWLKKAFTSYKNNPIGSFRLIQLAPMGLLPMVA